MSGKTKQIQIESNPEILAYYDKLANQYDEDRFSNTYGKFIHRQENKVLARFFKNTDFERNLDLACGTGRFLEFANFGLDISPKMVEVASEKYPEKNIRIGNAQQLPFEDNFLQNVYSMHLFMHLQRDQIKKILEEVHRAIAPGGHFIFDIPSHKRRQLTRYNTNSWHGANQTDYRTLSKITQKNWEIVAFHGIAFLPIHRIPKSIRKYFVKVDNFLCGSWLKELSSHLIFILRKK